MTGLGDFLKKQAQLSLNNEKYAWFLTALLAVIPFSASLSLSVMALVTLRKGWLAGFKCLIVGLTASICFAEVAGTMSVVLSTLLLTFIICYVCACILRETASWHIVAGFVVFLATSTILLVHGLAPDYISQQYQTLQQILRAVDGSSSVADLLSHQNAENQASMANYLLGIKAISLAITAIFSLMLARAAQSSLYNPGGFKKEMLAFRAHGVGVLLLVACVCGAYQSNLVLLSCLPVFFVYLMAAGVSLGLNMLARRKRLVTMTLLFVPIILAPYIMLPVYVLFGSIDSLFNLRSRRLFLAGENQNKG